MKNHNLEEEEDDLKLSIDKEEEKPIKKQLWTIDGYKIWAYTYEEAIIQALKIQEF